MERLPAEPPPGQSRRTADSEAPLGHLADRADYQSEVDPTERSPLASPFEKIFLYAVLTLIVTGMAYALATVGRTAGANYGLGLRIARRVFVRDQQSSGLSLAYVLQLSRAYDFVIVKSAALFLGYTVVVVGCMFVLKGVEASYRLQLARAATRSTLETSSPGLVLITIGAALVAVTVMVQSTIQIHTPATPLTRSLREYGSYVQEPLP